MAKAKYMDEFELESLVRGSNANDVFQRVAELRKSGAIHTEGEAVAEVIRRLLKRGLPDESSETIEGLVPRITAAMMDEPKLANRLRRLLNAKGQ